MAASKSALRCDGRSRRGEIPKELSRLFPTDFHFGRGKQTAAALCRPSLGRITIPVIVEIRLSPVRLAAVSDSKVFSDLLPPGTCAHEIREVF